MILQVQIKGTPTRGWSLLSCAGSSAGPSVCSSAGQDFALNHAPSLIKWQAFKSGVAAEELLQGDVEQIGRWVDKAPGEAAAPPGGSVGEGRPLLAG